jgi:O-antigen/teichoic acid export membrane protein
VKDDVQPGGDCIVSTSHERSSRGRAMASPQTSAKSGGRTQSRLAGRLRGLLRSQEVWYYLSKILAGIFSLLSVILLVRVLGEAEYGLVAVGLAAATVASLFSSGWASHALLRASGSRRVDSLPRALRVLSFVVAAPVVLCIVLLSQPSTGAEPALLVSAAALGIALSMQYLTSIDLLSIQNAHYYVRSDFIRLAGGAILACAAAIATGEAWVALLGLAVAALAASIRPRRAVPGEFTALSRAEVASWWAYGWPMALWFALSTLLQFGGRFVVAASAGLDAAGYYSAVYDTVTRAATMALYPLVMAGHPRIMSLWNVGRRSAAVQECRLLARRQGWLSVVALVGGVCLSPFAIPLIGLRPLGHDVLVVVLLLLGGLLWQAALVVHKPLEIEGRTRYMLGAVLLAVIVNMGGAAVFVPSFGVPAAAMASVAGALTYLLLVLPPWRRFISANHDEQGSLVGP